MDYCGPRGIPHSVFLGRPVGPGEPTWTVDDRQKALWWLIHDAEKCKQCGHRAEEFDPARGGDLHALEWTARHCRGCEILAQGDDWLRATKTRRGTTIGLQPPRPRPPLPPPEGVP